MFSGIVKLWRGVFNRIQLPETKYFDPDRLRAMLVQLAASADDILKDPERWSIPEEQNISKLMETLRDMGADFESQDYRKFDPGKAQSLLAEADKLKSVLSEYKVWLFKYRNPQAEHHDTSAGVLITLKGEIVKHLTALTAAFNSARSHPTHA